MKWLNQKIENYVKWLAQSGYGVRIGFKEQATTVVVPSEQYFEEYVLESGQEIEPLTEKERRYLKIKCKNIVFDLVLKGKIPQIAVKTLLAYYCEMNDKVEKKKTEEKPTVVFKMGEISNAKPFITPENLSFENEAIEKLKMEERKC